MVLSYKNKCSARADMISSSASMEPRFFGGSFISCERTAKVLARLRGCIGSPEHSMIAYYQATMSIILAEIRNIIMVLNMILLTSHWMQWSSHWSSQTEQGKDSDIISNEHNEHNHN